MFDKINQYYIILLSTTFFIDCGFCVGCITIFRIFGNFTLRKVTKLRIYVTYLNIFLTSILDVCLFGGFFACLTVFLSAWGGKSFSIRSLMWQINLNESRGIFSSNYKIAKMEENTFEALDDFEKDVYLEQYFKTCEKLPSRTRIILIQATAWGIGSLIGLGINLIS
ncbi:MAG: hypothetical protein E7551_06525 [Ruminococcaceae bacterium]|nr:hypothetical protein [Oscillospiraceae bacterium]